MIRIPAAVEEERVRLEKMHRQVPAPEMAALEQPTLFPGLQLLMPEAEAADLTSLFAARMEARADLEAAEPAETIITALLLLLELQILAEAVVVAETTEMVALAVQVL